MVSNCLPTPANKRLCLAALKTDTLVFLFFFYFCLRSVCIFKMYTLVDLANLGKQSLMAVERSAKTLTYHLFFFFFKAYSADLLANSRSFTHSAATENDHSFGLVFLISLSCGFAPWTLREIPFYFNKVKCSAAGLKLFVCFCFWAGSVKWLLELLLQKLYTLKEEKCCCYESGRDDGKKKSPLKLKCPWRVRRWPCTRWKRAYNPDRGLVTEFPGDRKQHTVNFIFTYKHPPFKRNPTTRAHIALYF